MFYVITYVIFLCSPAHVDCQKAHRTVETVNGMAHYEYRYGKKSDCQQVVDDLNKTLADKGWYECRRFDGRNPNSGDTQE